MIYIFIPLLAALFLFFCPPVQAADGAGRSEFFLEERGLGNPKAPKLIIEEFASFTCPHCAEFHRAVFPYLKEKYIDTGMAYFIYTDFPWDEAALDAAVIARCIPPEKYFDFISLLYAEQKEWAYHDDHELRLISRAEKFGVPTAKLHECLNNQVMKAAIVAKMQKSKLLFRIESTPSLMLNGEEYVNGDMSVDEVIESIDKYLAEKFPR